MYVTRALITTILSVFAAVGLVVVLIELGLGQVCDIFHRPLPHAFFLTITGWSSECTRLCIVFPFFIC